MINNFIATLGCPSAFIARLMFLTCLVPQIGLAGEYALYCDDEYIGDYTSSECYRQMAQRDNRDKNEIESALRLSVLPAAMGNCECKSVSIKKGFELPVKKDRPLHDIALGDVGIEFGFDQKALYFRALKYVFYPFPVNFSVGLHLFSGLARKTDAVLTDAWEKIQERTRYLHWEWLPITVQYSIFIGKETSPFALLNIFLSAALITHDIVVQEEWRNGNPDSDWDELSRDRKTGTPLIIAGIDLLIPMMSRSHSRYSIYFTKLTLGQAFGGSGSSIRDDYSVPGFFVRLSGSFGMILYQTSQVQANIRKESSHKRISK
ncbi:MAG: hypothetical protein QNJ97_18965 [Myxococcota bacterium]|nr:hypothetical protein [Myxococcota bacterium]